MKKILLTTIIVLSAILGFAGHVDKATALKVANTFRDNNKAYQASLQRGRAVTPLADLTGKTAFGNFYIFSDEHSFVIVSAEDCVQPILAYSMENPFKTENMPESVIGWMQGYDEQIGIAKTRSASATNEVKQAWELLKSGKPLPITRDIVVEPMISTKWDQTTPYNNLCPVVASGGSGGRAYTGCVATAMAQIMKFWNYPEHGIGSHSYEHGTYGTQTADYGATTYDWDNMKNVYSSGGYTTDEANAVATLMYHCGVSVDMNYGSGGSGAPTSWVAGSLKTYFNYSQSLYHAYRDDYVDNEWIAMLKNDLDAGRPIQYHGSSESGSGHSFVCDGYDSDGNFSFNWGWSGYCDGYYVINNLTPGTGGSGAGQGSYNVGQGAIFGIEPPTSTIEAPLNLTAAYDNGTAVLNWGASIGAASYNVYRNGLQIASATTETYTDNAVPYGTVRYYVRAVDSEGLLSLPSNYADVTRAYGQPVVNDLSASIDSNNVTLTWTAPEWCYPETESAKLTYGDESYLGDMDYQSAITVYYGHRYPAEDLASYANKSVYKVETYVKDDDTYQIYVYTGSTNGKPKTLSTTKSVEIAGTVGWVTIDLDAPVSITGDEDIWVLVSKIQKFPLSQNTSGNTNGLYMGTSVSNLTNSYASSYSALIRTYLTDGVYTYNIYRNTANRNAVKIAENLNATIYTDFGLDYGHYEYYVKTNYYKGESDASNVFVVDLEEPVVEYTVTTAVSPAESGSVTGDNTYEAGTICTVTATPADNYYFTHFENSIVNGIITDNPYTFTVTSNCTVTAYFATVEVGNIEAPAAICSGNALSLTAPEVTGDVQSAGWQLADNAEFNSPVAYTDQMLDSTYNGCYLRYWVNNTNLGDLFSNAVQITINSPVEYSDIRTSCGDFVWIDGETYSVTTLGEHTFTKPNATADGCDSIYTLYLTVNSVAEYDDVRTSCGDFVWIDGETYGVTTLGEHTYTKPNATAEGCDSIYTLYLTVNSIAEYDDVRTSCGDFVWMDGETYGETTLGEHQYTVPQATAEGCDSIYTLYLTVNSATEGIDSIEVCGSYTWIDGVTYDESNYTATYTLEGANQYGCDSIVTLNLTISYSEDITLDPLTVCDSYDWYGETITESQTLTHTDTTATGCIQNKTLELTVNYSNEGIDEQEVCDSYTWIDGETYTEDNNTATYTIVGGNQYGCDSTVTLNLTVKKSYEGSFSVSSAKPYTWDSTEYSASGDYTKRYDAANGCDSLVTLHFAYTGVECYDRVTPSSAGEYVMGYLSGTTLTMPTHNSGTARMQQVTVNPTSSGFFVDDNNNPITVTLESASSGKYYISCTDANGNKRRLQRPSSNNSAATWAAANSTTRTEWTINSSGITQQTTTMIIFTTTHYLCYYNNTFYVRTTSTNNITFYKKGDCHCEPDESEITVNDACDVYTWKGTEYTESGSYVFDTITTLGCDSTITLNLTVNYSTYGDTTAVVCDSFSWYEHENITESSNELTHTFVNASGCDSIVTLNLTVNHSDNIELDPLTVCDSYKWNDSTYTLSGIYVQEFKNAFGCDSIVTLNLTVNHSDNIELDSLTVCDSYKWNDSTYTVSGTYVQEFKNALGCDSIVTLNLTVNYSDNIELTPVTACDSYEWNDSTYTVSGIYIQEFENAIGCDSIVTLNLTVNYSDHTGNVTETACDSLVWNGTTYYEDGDYPFNTLTVHGCDSTVTLHLTVNHSEEVELNPITVCDSYKWNDSTYTTSGIYVQEFKNALGCDSIVTLNLTVNYSDNVELTPVTACDSFKWNDSTYTTSGIYVQEFENIFGCDSIVTLTLTINNTTYGTDEKSVCETQMPYTWQGVEFTEAGSQTITIENAAGCDSILTLTLSVNPTTYGNDETTVCESELPYTWQGVEFTEAGSQTITVENAAGCDSILTLTLNVNPTTYGNDETTVCESQMPYTWQGVEFTEAGSQTITIENAAGCDSVLTLTLSVNPTTYGNDETTVCESQLPYTWQGVEFTEAGSQTITIENAAGCDSVLTLTLFVNLTTYGNDETTVCESQLPYTWQGVEFTEAGSQNIIIENAAGCDSVVTLTLIVNQAVTNILEPIAVCDSYDWYGDIITESQTLTHIETAANGCDSIVTLNLTVNHADDVTIDGVTEIVAGEETTLTASEGASYEWSNGETTQSITVAPVANTTYSVVVTDENGCTSTAEITVNVTEGIAETEVAVKVYPNPVKHSVSIEADGITKVRVIDMLGQTLYETRENGNTIRIDMSGFAVGQYFIEVSTSKGLATQKVVKQ